MELSQEIASLLRCPETGQPLHAAITEELDGFDGDFPEGAFVTEDGSRLYPIRDGLPHLVATEAVERT